MKCLFASDIHGDWVEFYELARVVSPDVIFLAGDVETTRNEKDMETILGHKRGRKLGDFHKFWKQGSVPIPTYFILGNHEPFPWFNELEQNQGSPVRLMDNLFYLGRTGWAESCGLKLAWFSRIYGQKTFYGTKRYNPKDKRSPRSKIAAHFLPEDVSSLKKAVEEKKVDILLVHENPCYASTSRHEKIYSEIVGFTTPQ
ncbi:MAG: metallophosphoesterase [Deltaproteobacteria bacterium]|jgi:DNA repair exonuclease SbcCD nuclease subunit|nr:metallophosphoesterase [Deltaproteobacteria bacterium]